MKTRLPIVNALAAVLLLTAALAPTALRAGPAHPTLLEVNGVVDMLGFRGGMLADPGATVAAFAAAPARGRFAAIDKQMSEAGSGAAGWRLLLGTAVFTAAGLNQPRTLVVFYNPWVDTAVFTLWQARSDRWRIIDIDWAPGDLVRQAAAEVDPRPLWLRGEAYRPETLAEAVATTVKAIETRFADQKQIAAWRDTLGIEDSRDHDTYIAPILAMRLYETQMRLKALAVPTSGEDPRLALLRASVAGLIEMVTTEGFAKPLAEAGDTTAPMRQALAMINPKTMNGLSPVAFVAGEGQATVFFASIATADYTLSARFAESAAGYALQQLEFIPYAATYQLAVGQGPETGQQ